MFWKLSFLVLSIAASLSRAFISEWDEVVGIPSWQLLDFERMLVDSDMDMDSDMDSDRDRNLKASVIGFADPEECYPTLEEADANRDRLLMADEYVDYLKLMGPPGFLDGIEAFAELPLILKVNFNVLACLCQSDPAEDSCCVGSDAAIVTDGAYAEDAPTPAEESYLFLVCSLTGTSIERVLDSLSPSRTPTQSPTLNPTLEPTTPEPSSSPTTSPVTLTLDPTATPISGSPTAAPVTLAPTTLSPTEAPTTASPTTAVPTAAPTTLAPTQAPVPTEAPQPVEEELVTVYQIGVENGGNREVYEPRLVDAMDSLAPEVLAELQRRMLRVGRRLQSVQIPTTIDDISVIDCPGGIPEEDVCEDVTSTITLIFQPDEADGAEGVAEDFAVSLEDEIMQGELMDALNLLWPGGDVYIIDDTVLLPIDDDDESDRSISGGGISGIVIGSLVAVLAVGFLASRRGPPKEELQELEPAPQNSLLQEEELPEDLTDLTGTLGAVSPDYGKNSDAMMDNDEAMATMSQGENSSAGSSGWSSSAGISSLNTGSQDGLSAEGPIASLGTTLAAAVGGSRSPNGSTSSRSGDRSVPSVTRADLDSAIEAGDWAAVGATAALLAAHSDSQSQSTQGGPDQSLSQGNSLDSALDAARAAELDHLVESGDWEGVVLAAAKYEAAESRGESGSNGSGSRSNTAGGLDTSSMASTPSKARKRQELRAEVEDLVRRVVPEEIQNVDEMMVQFRGREEELIETLRTMEERAVAQKARQGAQKQAKVQAKLKTSEERAADATALLAAIPGPGSPEVEEADPKRFRTSEEESVSPAMVAKSLGTGQVTAAQSLGSGQTESPTKSKSLGTGSITAMAAPPSPDDSPIELESDRSSKQNALEQAIEAGDWEAVGEAAAMLSDRSLASSVETDELNRLADGISSQGSGSVSRDNLSNQAEELEALIEKGDWTGVVNAAAAKSTETPKKTKKEIEEDRRQRRMKHVKDEEDALAQADIWEAIAEQTKPEDEENTSDQAAANAANWAIGRSLQALVEAEQGDNLTREDSSKAGSSRYTSDDSEEEV